MQSKLIPFALPRLYLKYIQVKNKHRNLTDREKGSKKMSPLIESNRPCIFTSQHKDKLNAYKRQPEGTTAAWSLEGNISHMSWLFCSKIMTVLAQAFRNISVMGPMS